jgi:hypothetical protein
MSDERTVEEIKETIGDASEDELLALSQDERVTVQDAVAAERAERARAAQEEAAAQVDEEGEKVRYEDDPKNFPQGEEFEPAELSAPEVPLEESRKDETTVLATDTEF